jgi:Tfp pilus assembly protein PilW
MSRIQNIFARLGRTASRAGKGGMQDGRKQRGFTLVEAIIYVALLVLVVTVVIVSIVAMVRSQRNVKNHILIQESVAVSFDRMIREIHDAISVDISSSLNTNPGRLILNGVDSTGDSRVVEFYVNGGRLVMREDGSDVGPLTVSGVTINNIVFRHIDTASTDAVKIEMTLSSGTGGEAKSESFYTTGVLRSSY